MKRAREELLLRGLKIVTSEPSEEPTELRRMIQEVAAQTKVLKKAIKDVPNTKTEIKEVFTLQSRKIEMLDYR